jgi:hypothetical protein
MLLDRVDNRFGLDVAVRWFVAGIFLNDLAHNGTIVHQGIHMIILILLLVEHDEAQVQALEDELTKVFGPYALMDTLWHCQVELTFWRNLSQDTAMQTCQPGPHPFWIRPDAVRSSRPFIRNAVPIKMWRRGLSIAPWWPWNSWSSELAADMASQEAGVAGVATRGTCPPGAGQVYLRAGK